MKLPAIKKLVETYSLEQCLEAENQLLEGEKPQIDIEGADEGEQLTHVLGAIDILTRVRDEQKDLKTATREFIERVRNSISG